ncbi:delta(3,5)-Delta(2,4)-dienoyl-CoA isomerase, mitochondrial-like [Lytechinus variegatus]|uniref:delta(3,5)-Delta(2,4)-dienoyl-CoA isomerase, mitochondrial-like n=1 Tax=Lytechinus variegatus TaxID=7654 RepID=UPI001BB1911C|nr:delta(3,5)-Delta(2,4)-dienoyl-CoA isomerase, mitochondrial-like [Lytechinus variegatus]
MNSLAKVILSTARKGNLTKIGLGRTLARSMSSEGLSKYNFESLAVTNPQEFIYKVEVNRPEKRNAMNRAFWREMVECFNTIATDQDCRVVLLTGSGKTFSAGIDLQDNAELMQGAVPGSSELDVARIANKIRLKVKEYQESFFVIEKCPKPVIAAVQGGCLGGGLCMISGCDIRICTEDAWFQIKETDLGLAADVGVLQWLPPKTGNDSLLRELCFTARKFDSKEAKEIGLVSRLYPDKEAMVAGAMELAAIIASKSPVAVQGTKVHLNYSRDHSVADSFEYAATWNSAHLQSEDLVKAVMASMAKSKPEFSKL